MKTYIILYTNAASDESHYYLTQAFDQAAAMSHFACDTEHDCIFVNYNSIQLFEATKLSPLRRPPNKVEQL